MAYEKDQPVRFQREKGARIMDATVRHDDSGALLRCPDDTGRWGEIWLGQDGLKVAVTTAHFDVPQCLLHELMHAVIETKGVKSGFRTYESMEAIVDAVSHGVVELLRRNKGLAQFLIDGE
jgi:hypothetical protein